jgi:hypothetical protein
MNGTIVDVTQGSDQNGVPIWTVNVRLDGGSETEIALTAPQVVRLMAAAKSSTTHFPGGRCQLESGELVAVQPKTPFPIA